MSESKRCLSGKNVLFAFISGIIMGLTVAPFSLWYLAWISVIPLWIIIRKSQSWPILPSFAWGCGYHGLALFWITGIHPMTWMGVPWLSSLLIAIFVWSVITLWGAILVTIWGFLFKFLLNLKLTNKPSLLLVFLGVCLWCGLEKIWSYSPLWWTSLSFTQSPHNLTILQLLKVSGTTTITALIIAVNGLLAEGLLKLSTRDKNYSKDFLKNFDLGLIGVVFWGCSHILAFYLYNQPVLDPISQEIKVGIIQGNIPNEIKLYPQGWREAIEGYTRGYEILARQGVDVILTPETALPFDYDKIKSNSSFYQTLLREKIPTWLGAFGKHNHNFTNSLFSIKEDGKIISRYDKVNLVPLGEYIPFANILGRVVDRLSPLDAHLISGKQNQIFHTPFGQAIVSICYDSAFSEHFRRQTAQGGEFIVTASNNAHYSATMPAQHHAQDVMRAIESDRWAARATNTGYSAIVDPHGRTLWISHINTYELHIGTIYRRQTQTLYVKFGDWLMKLLCLLLIFYLLFAYINTLNRDFLKKF
jgi:apolipoprotein N-acyltransferase